MKNSSAYSAQRQLDLQRTARTDTQVCMFEDSIPTTAETCIYLTPTFSDTKCSHNHFWHIECRELLRELGYHGLILIPQSRNSCGGNKQERHLRWCHAAQTRASHLIFFIDKNQNYKEVRQIIHQLGAALGRKSAGNTQTILLSVPNKRIFCPLTKYSLTAERIPIFSNLHALLRYMMHDI